MGSTRYKPFIERSIININGFVSFYTRCCVYANIPNLLYEYLFNIYYISKNIFHIYLVKVYFKRVVENISKYILLTRF